MDNSAYCNLVFAIFYGINMHVNLYIYAFCLMHFTNKATIHNNICAFYTYKNIIVKSKVQIPLRISFKFACILNTENMFALIFGVVLFD